MLSYIYPRAFVCEDEFDSKYLFYEMESSEHRDGWLVCKIKESSYCDLVDRKISIQSVYKKAAREKFSIIKNYDNEEKCELISECKAWMEALPRIDVFAEKTNR